MAPAAPTGPGIRFAMAIELSPSWRRICGVHVQGDGQVAAVWIAWDKDADCLHLYDCHLHEREVLAVQAETIKRRGKWVPVAWHDDAREIVEKLLDHGCNTLPEGVKNSDPIAETVSLDIWERMRTGRFKVSPHLASWLEEFKTFQRQQSRVPRDTHPLMAATRHAVAMLEYARSEPRKTGAAAAPKLAII